MRATHPAFRQALLFSLLALPLGVSQAADPFMLVSSTIDIGATGQCHGIAFDGVQWHVANFSSPWRTFDTAFVQTGTVTVPGGVGEMRGLAFDVASGNLFLGGYGTQTVVESTTAGVVVNSFPTGLASGFNAVTVNDIDGSIWVEGYGGDFRHLTRTGAFLGSFSTAGLNWTGLAYDEGRDTLLMLESSNDTVHEYTPAGVSLGLAIATDAVNGNGQGLAYDSATGVLHVTGQTGSVWVWSRSTPFPPPTCTLTAPAGPVSRDALLSLDSTSASSATLDATFEYSLDGGATYMLCTPSATSPVSTNPAVGLATGPASFEWDTVADGVGLASVAAGTLARATIDDGVAPVTGDCTSAPFDVDSSAVCLGFCGDCNQTSAPPDILDALAAAQFAAGLGAPTPQQLPCCDVNSSGAVEILDALSMAQAAAGLPVTLACP